jgi:hypothetical protein
MELPRLRYDERIDGWRGVVRAIQREIVTRANWDACRFARGPVLHLRGVEELLLVGGRVVAVFKQSIVLFDVDTGARLASLDVASISIHEHAVLDRWIPFAAVDGRLLLLDCVAARLVEMASAGASRDGGTFSVAGPRVSFRAGRSTDITVTHVSGGPDSTTVMREVARLTLPNDDVSRFVLCERGHSYLLCNYISRTLQLMHIATGKLKHIFASRALFVLYILRSHSYGASRGHMQRS